MEPDEVLSLRDYLLILRRRIWWILGITAVTVGTAVFVTSQQTPLYEGSTEVLVEQIGGGDSASALEQALLGQGNLATQRRLVTSLPVTEAVVERLKLDTAPRELWEQVEVEVLRDTSVLEIRATDPDPARAADLSQAFAEEYLDHRRGQAVERLLQTQTALQERARTLRARLDEVERQLSTGATEHDSPQAGTAPGEQASPPTGPDALRRERDSLLTQLAQVTTQLVSLEGAGEVGRSGGEIIVPASVPEEPVSPRPVRSTALALVLGVMLGVGVAFLVDHLDDAVRSDDDVKRATRRPVIGHIPHWKDARRTGRLVSLMDPWSPAAEAYRTLRTNIRFLTGVRTGEGGPGGAGTSLLVTSPESREGKTTTAGNLAVAAARAGSRVVLVDADLRRSETHRRFGQDRTRGLADLLVGEVELPDAALDVGVENLRVLPAGSTPPNPAELLGSPAMIRLMARLEENADLVVYDSPPVLAVSDAMEIAPTLGRVLLVLQAGTSHRRALAAATERLSDIGTTLIGSVMNDIAPGADYYSYHRYYGRYVADRPAEDRTVDGPPAREAPTTPGEDRGGQGRPERAGPEPEDIQPAGARGAAPGPDRAGGDQPERARGETGGTRPGRAGPAAPGAGDSRRAGAGPRPSGSRAAPAGRPGEHGPAPARHDGDLFGPGGA